MKIFVLCDSRGNIQSVTIPDQALADRINIQVDDGGRVHKLDVDSSVLDPAALRDLTAGKAHKEIYDKLRKLI